MFVGKLLSFVFVLLVIILYAFLSYDVLGSLACLSVCVCVCMSLYARASESVEVLPGSDSFLLLTFLCSVQFLPLLLHGVRYSLSL